MNFTDHVAMDGLYPCFSAEDCGSVGDLERCVEVRSLSLIARFGARGYMKKQIAIFTSAGSKGAFSTKPDGISGVDSGKMCIRDRCIAVDENGNVIDGDLILYVCGKYLKENGRLNGDTIVTTIMSNLGLYKACDKAGLKYEKTAVGDKYVYENMVQNDYSLGGEQSGHIIFSKHATTGDGILTSLMVMEVILEKKMSLGKLAEAVKILSLIHI